MHSVEASSATFALLQQDAASGRFANWHVHHNAIWTDSGELRFENSETSSGGHIAAEPSGGDEVVEAVRLDDLIRRHTPGRVTLLKLDIEGAEGPVLADAEGVLDLVDNLVIEIHPEVADEARVMAALCRHFPHVQPLVARGGGMPLVLARRAQA